MATIRAHFDGKVLVPDEPLDLEINQAVELEIIRPAAKKQRSMHELIGWALKFPPNPNPGPELTDDELWETNKRAS